MVSMTEYEALVKEMAVLEDTEYIPSSEDLLFMEDHIQMFLPFLVYLDERRSFPESRRSERSFKRLHCLILRNINIGELDENDGSTG